MPVAGQLDALFLCSAGTHSSIRHLAKQAGITVGMGGVSEAAGSASVVAKGNQGASTHPQVWLTYSLFVGCLGDCLSFGADMPDAVMSFLGRVTHRAFSSDLDQRDWKQVSQ